MSWSQPPQELERPDDEVHVWRASLDRPAGVRARLERVLSEEERRRAERIVAADGRDRWVVGRALLRAILARYVGFPAEQVPLEAETGGKPALRSANAELHFNLSHSAALALIAVTGAGPIGVDVQGVREVDHERIADRVFSGAEQEALRALPESERGEAFFVSWTRKEAYAKGIGSGLLVPLNSFSVLPLEQGSGTLAVVGADGEDRGWSVWDLAPGGGYAGALAVEGAPAAAHCWDLTPRERTLLRGPFPRPTAA